MVFAQKILAPGPGIQLKNTFSGWPIQSGFERFTAFHASGFAGDHGPYFREESYE